MFEVKLYELDFNKIPECTRVICVSKYKDKWVFCKQKGKDTWEIPGGHIEKGEDWLTAGRREMFEETGAIDIEIVPICLYSISTYGLLCYADIKEMAKLPDFEIGEVKLFDDLPTNLTYPSHKMFFEKVKEKLLNKIR